MIEALGAEPVADVEVHIWRQSFAGKQCRLAKEKTDSNGRIIKDLEWRQPVRVACREEGLEAALGVIKLPMRKGQTFLILLPPADKS